MSKISGYTTCFEASSRGQQLELSLESFLVVCDEIVVVDCNDSNSPTDDSSERLRQFAAQQSRLRIVDAPIDTSDPAVAAFELMYSKPTLARQECTGDALLRFELDDVADTERVDELRDLAERLEFDDPRISGYVLPKAHYCGDASDCSGLSLIDAQRGMNTMLTRNDPTLVHDVPRTHRRFAEDGTLRILGTLDPSALVHNTNLSAAKLHTVFDSRLADWLETARGADSRALLARDRIQDELNAALERGPAVFSTEFLDPTTALRWRRDRLTPLVDALFGEADREPVTGRPWSQLEDGDLARITAESQQLGGTRVRCGRVPPQPVLERAAQLQGAAR